MDWPGVLKAYKDYLPVTADTPLITLSEGNTPLIKARHINTLVGAEVYFKFEGLNPTGSFKDRGMVVAVAKAIEQGSKAIMCASTGNTSASAAAYAARSGLQCIVLIPEGKIALGKLAQALIYGAKVVAIDGNFDQALQIVRDITSRHPVTLVNSVNPYRIEGQKTAAFEICDRLGKAPDFLAIPVGNAGNITAYWKGFCEYYERRKISSKPRMIGFEAEGAAAIVKGKVIEKPETIATAIRIGNPASWQGASAAARDSDGLIDFVTDEEIVSAYKMLASFEGLFVEPASAASVAGIFKMSAQKRFNANQKIVCVLTGHGLKDPDTAINNISNQPQRAPAETEIIEKIILEG